MDKYDQLAIRTCKKCKGYDITIKRLKRIYSKRCYLKKDNVSEWHLTMWLIDIIEKHTTIKMPTSSFISDVYDRYCIGRMLYKETRPFEYMIEVVIHKLAFTRPEDLIGYEIPIKWKNKFLYRKSG